jgi:branched-chain amino acid aminotransferase
MINIESSVAFLSGNWLPCSQISLAIDDIGFLQGVTAVERLRTWNGQLPVISAHLIRFKHTTDTLGIVGLPGNELLENLLLELIDRNRPNEDVGITMFATPGRRGLSKPTLAIHLTALDHTRLQTLRTDGQPLVITQVLQPDPQCWPRTIKVRSRVHYHLADSFARRYDPNALGILLDSDGSVTETSTSNLLVATENNTLILPPAARVLPGVMANLVCDIAKREGWHIERRPLMPEVLLTANSVWLTGSEVGLWWASSIDRVQKPLDPRLRKFQLLVHEQLCSP